MRLRTAVPRVLTVIQGRALFAERLHGPLIRSPDVADRNWQAAAHERLAEGEHGVERRLHNLADQLNNPDRVHRDADDLSERADEHRARAEQLRTETSMRPDPEPPLRGED